MVVHQKKRQRNEGGLDRRPCSLNRLEAKTYVEVLSEIHFETLEIRPKNNKTEYVLGGGQQATGREGSDF